MKNDPSQVYARFLVPVKRKKKNPMLIGSHKTRLKFRLHSKVMGCQKCTEGSNKPWNASSETCLCHKYQCVRSFLRRNQTVSMSQHFSGTPIATRDAKYGLLAKWKAHIHFLLQIGSSFYGWGLDNKNSVSQQIYNVLLWGPSTQTVNLTLNHSLSVICSEVFFILLGFKVAYDMTEQIRRDRQW